MYFWVVGALAVAQIGAGIVTAHYGVEGTEFYGIALAEIVPYSLSRTWHVQLGMLWIATSWLATGLCLVPLITGREPRFQRLGVNLLLAALVVVVAGSMLGQAFAIHQVLGDKTNFWVGHQGYEYLDLGRLWQALLLAGLLLWLALMLRPLLPAWRDAKGDSRRRQFLGIFILSIGAIAFFYSPGLIPGQHTNLAIAEYWRWWVVHLWVEGFFEVFATAVISLVFVRLGLVRVQSAVMAILFTTILYLTGGVLGMFHHLYFTGTTPVILVIGGTFSALELMPLVMIGFEAYENLSMTRRTSWIHHYKWPVFFCIASAFWNLVGAGLFGFLINPPIALYYMQGLNTTSVHAHAALFGVYGNLGLGLTLLSLRILTVRRQWRTGSLSLRLLVNKHRAGADGPDEPASGGTCPDLGQRGARDVVRPLGRISADSRSGSLPVAALHRGHHIRRGHPGNWLVRDRTFRGMVRQRGPIRFRGSRSSGLVSQDRLRLTRIAALSRRPEGHCGLGLVRTDDYDRRSVGLENVIALSVFSRRTPAPRNQGYEQCAGGK